MLNGEKIDEIFRKNYGLNQVITSQEFLVTFFLVWKLIKL